MFRDVHRFPRAKLIDGIAIVSMHAPRLSFYNFPWFREGLEAIEAQHDVVPVEITVTPAAVEIKHDIVSLDDEPVDVAINGAGTAVPDLSEKPTLHTIIVDCTHLDGIDATSIQYLREMVKSYHEKGRLLLFAHANKAIVDLLKLSGTVAEADTAKYIWPTLSEATEYAVMNGAEECKVAQEAALAGSHHGHRPAGVIGKAGKQIDKILPVSKLFSAEFSANEISLI